MIAATPSTIYLKDYSSPDFKITKTELQFELTDTLTIVTNTLHLQRLKQDASDLVLDGEALTLQQVSLNAQVLDITAYQVTPLNLLIKNVPDSFTLTIVTLLNPQQNTQLSGLYYSNGMFCTQCEAQGFRRITYYLDRPDVLASFETTLIANKTQYPVLLSNGNLVAQYDGVTQHSVTWRDPFLKPCYLFALVAGNLASVSDNFVTKSGRCISLKIYVELGNENKCAHAMASLKQAMRWDEEVYGLEYDLDIYMIVAVNDFNMGAMENKGLNLFNAKYVLACAKTATDSDFAHIQSVVAHEYFHNWTGNRVTCRDWFQLSLKEGLTIFRDQEFSKDLNSRDVNRIHDVMALRNQQFPEDASPMAHPVRPESYIEINNFYTATIYNKGAEVIRMQHTLLGALGFRRGMDLYFARHDGCAVTIDDFVAAMADANQVDFSQFKQWYRQIGTPRVVATITYDAAKQQLRLQLVQQLAINETGITPQPLVIPIKFALFDHSGKQLELATELLILKELTQEFEFNAIATKPIVSLLREFSAPIILEIAYSNAELQLLMQYESDGFARWEAAQRFANHYITELIAATTAGITLKLPQALLMPYQTILASAIPIALQAELLNLPKFNDIANTMPCIEVAAIVNALDYYHTFLGSHLFALFSQRYQALLQQAAPIMNASAYANRSLQNTCLGYLMATEHPTAIELCYQQFISAKTMTDEIAALALLAQVECPQRLLALEQFYTKWSHDTLVLDKWFAVQAGSKLPNTLQIVEKLVYHRDFTLTNPNKVRALIGTFCMHNPRNFHNATGSGYQFLATIIQQLDSLNPQLAAGLVAPLLRWRHYPKKGQLLMQQALLTIMKQPSLSRDVYEKVSKSLA